MSDDVLAGSSAVGPQVTDAENLLEAELLKVRPHLEGVNGYGARVDPSDMSVSLSVSADAAGSAQLSQALPDEILGLPVIVVARRAAVAG